MLSVSLRGHGAHNEGFLDGIIMVLRMNEVRTSKANICNGHQLIILVHFPVVGHLN